MSSCESCGDYMSVGAALKAGLVQSAKAGVARADVRGFNGFCRCEGFVNSVAKEEEGCLGYFSASLQPGRRKPLQTRA